MTHMSHTTTTATPRDGARPPQPQHPTFGEMLEEVITLGTGLGVTLLPFLLLAVPSIVLFVALPAILLAAAAAIVAAVGAVIAGPPYLVARWMRRRRTAGPAVGRSRSTLRSARTSGRPRVPGLGRG
jgi:hypothetical protein